MASTPALHAKLASTLHALSAQEGPTDVILVLADNEAVEFVKRVTQEADVGGRFHAQCIDSFYNNVSVPYIGLEWQHIDPHGNTNRSSCYQYTLATD